MPTHQQIRIKMSGYDHALLDRAAGQIVKTAKNTGAITSVVPLPNKNRIVTVIRSPHVYKKSCEQFKQATHTRLIDIWSNDSKTIDQLAKLKLPSGIEVEIKA